MGAEDKQYVQLLAPGQKFQVEFKPGSEAAVLSGEYRVTEIKSGRGRGGTLNVIAVDMAGNLMPDVPIEDPKHRVVIADRCFGTSAWPMVQKFSIEGRLIYEAETEIKAVAAKKTDDTRIKKIIAAPTTSVAPKVPKPRSMSGVNNLDAVSPTATIPPTAADGAGTEKSSFIQQRTQLTNARVHATANQPKKVYDCLLPILENSKAGKPLLLRFAAVPMTNELNGDYSVIDYKKVDEGQPALVINLQSLDIPNKVVKFETNRTDIHIKRIDEITQPVR
jgi:hypothetical protein